MKYLQNAWTRKSGSGLGRKYIDMNGGGRLLHSTYCKKKEYIQQNDYSCNQRVNTHIVYVKM